MIKHHVPSFWKTDSDSALFKVLQFKCQCCGECWKTSAVWNVFILSIPLAVKRRVLNRGYGSVGNDFSFFFVSLFKQLTADCSCRSLVVTTLSLLVAPLLCCTMAPCWPLSSPVALCCSWISCELTFRTLIYLYWVFTASHCKLIYSSSGIKGTSPLKTNKQQIHSCEFSCCRYWHNEAPCWFSRWVTVHFSFGLDKSIMFDVSRRVSLEFLTSKTLIANSDRLTESCIRIVILCERLRDQCCLQGGAVSHETCLTSTACCFNRQSAFRRCTGALYRSWCPVSDASLLAYITGAKT